MKRSRPVTTRPTPTLDAGASGPRRALPLLDEASLDRVTGGASEWTWTDGGITAVDDWEARVV